MKLSNMKRLKKSAEQYDKRYRAVFNNMLTLFLKDCQKQNPHRIKVLFSSYERMWAKFAEGANSGAKKNNTPITCDPNAFKDFVTGEWKNVDGYDCPAEQRDELRRIFTVLKPSDWRKKLKAWLGTCMLRLKGIGANGGVTVNKPKAPRHESKLSVVK